MWQGNLNLLRLLNEAALIISVYFFTHEIMLVLFIWPWHSHAFFFKIRIHIVFLDFVLNVITDLNKKEKR